MVQTPVRFKKGIAVELRKKGLSYSDIKTSLNIPRSTIAYWLKDIRLSDDQVEKLKTKRSQIAKENIGKRTARILRETEEIKSSSSKEIGGITKRELWLMGLMLYWRERFLSGNESDVRKGVRFTSSDPDFIKLFLRWLQEIGRIDDEELAFDIFISKDKKSKLDAARNYWSGLTGFSRGHFSRVYYYRATGKAGHGKGSAKKGKNANRKSEHGLLRIRVKASSMLARQIAGWIDGARQRLFK